VGAGSQYTEPLVWSSASPRVILPNWREWRQCPVDFTTRPTEWQVQR